MKRIIVLLTVICLLFVSLGLPAVAVEAQTPAVNEYMEKYYSYDFNKDYAVNTEDAGAVLRAAAGIEKAPAGKSMDLDGDGAVTTDDARIVLRAAAGLEGAFTKSDILALFNAAGQDVKDLKPGLTGTVTNTSTSILITTTGMSISTIDMNVTNREFRDYCDDMIKKMELAKAFAIGADKKAEIQQGIDDLKAQKTEAYEPQSITKTAKTAGYHGSVFPVFGYIWTSKLTEDDLKSCTMKSSGGRLIITLTFNDYSYTGATYPTAKQYMDTIPYGRAFTMPVYNAATLANNKITLDEFSAKNGVITYSLDAVTGQLLHATYGYKYVSSTTKTSTAEEMGTTTDTTMTTKQFVTVSEVYDMTPFAAEA